MLSKLREPKIVLAVIIFLAFIVRLYGFSNPLADWHSWRQVDTSSVSRNFVNNGFDLLHPTYHDLSNVPSGKDNPKGYRFVEFPVYNLAQGGLFALVGVFTLEQWGRLVTIVSSLVTIVFLYLLIRKYAGEVAGLFTAFFYAFLPFSIYYGRTILPDTSAIMSMIGGIFFFDLWIEGTKKKNKHEQNKKYVYLLSAIFFTAAALLLKPFTIFFALPMFYLVWKGFGFSALKRWELWVFAILSLLPLILWRYWMTSYPEGIPANTWLFNGNGIRFRPSFFRWMVYERIIKLISGYAGFVLLLLGGFNSLRIKNAGLFYAFAISAILYVVVVATGNVQHDYYQILIMPTIAIFYGLGASFLTDLRLKKFSIHLGKALLFILIVGTLYFSWDFVKDYFNINNRQMVAVGKIVDQATPKDAKVIALYNGDTTFLYQTGRAGWTSYQDPLPVLIEKGADYLVQLDPTAEDRKSLGEQYEVVSQSPTYILIKLH